MLVALWSLTHCTILVVSLVTFITIYFNLVTLDSLCKENVLLESSASCQKQAALTRA